VLSTNLSAQLSAVLVALLLTAACRRWLLAGACSVALLAIGLTCGLAGLAVSGPMGEVARFLPASGTTPGTFLFRLELWGNVLHVLSDFRFTGVGLGARSVELALASYYPTWAEGYVPTSHAHNTFLQSYLEQGPLGLFGLLG